MLFRLECFPPPIQSVHVPFSSSLSHVKMVHKCRSAKWCDMTHDINLLKMAIALLPDTQIHMKEWINKIDLLSHPSNSPMRTSLETKTNRTLFDMTTIEFIYPLDYCHTNGKISRNFVCVFPFAASRLFCCRFLFSIKKKVPPTKRRQRR